MSLVDLRLLRARMSRYRRRLFEAAGSPRYSRPALHDLDRELEQYLDVDGGFFVEAGANDGFQQSNTYYLERFRGWSGVLVEAIPELYARCVANRPAASVFQCALVAQDYDGNVVKMRYADLMSLVDGAMKSAAADAEHLARAVTVQPGVHPYDVEVPARTLTWVLDQVNPPSIDLLSLDVEGYEVQVLRGLDLQRYRPSFILVEANFPEEVDAILLKNGYTLIERLSPRDILYAPD